jgi:ATP-dependent DNA helicase RecG
MRDAPRAGSADALDRPLASAGIVGITPGVAAKLAKQLALRTVRDLLEHAPRAYLDLSRTKTIGELKIGEDATISGTVARVDARPIRGRRHMLTVRIGDGTGYVDLVFWNQPFRAKQYALGTRVAAAGHVERRMGRLQLGGTVFVEILGGGSGETVHTGRIIPIHRATEGVSANQIRRFVWSALQRYGRAVLDPIPEPIRRGLDLMPRGDALHHLHFPESGRDRERARKRLAYEELFVLQTGLAARKHRYESESTGIPHTADGGDLVGRFLASLPFAPTRAQMRAIQEVSADLAAQHPMHRLLQGEVGSGKTVVAVAAALRAAAAGSQTAFMAPTEVLAEQHFLTVSKLLDPMSGEAPAGEGRLFGEGWGVELLTSNITGKRRQQALSAAASGAATIVIGTHALIQEGVAFRRLGLAIVDEQHRFGVHQRVALRAKTADATPDLLIMTATPIPRTLALTLYGDLEVSVLDEMPPGRLPVHTIVATTTAQRAEAERLIREAVAQGRQAFVICPLVEESAALEAKAAESEYARIKEDVFPDLRVGLIHGRMRGADKEATMRSMRNGDVDVLVATTVIEVGVDIPNATVMLVEDADRFGLSQLHQLRGRIGRGAAASTCILLTAADLDADDRATARRRLEAMAATTDGFRLAELDLEIRGEGQIFGRSGVDAGDGSGAPAQAGQTDLRFASLVRDVDTLTRARADAFALVERDPLLRDPEHDALRGEVRRRFGDRLDWLFVG